MLDKELLKLLGKDKKYLYYITIINIFGMLANLSIIALICLILHNVSISNNDINFYIITVIGIILLLIIKVLCNIFSTKIKNNLGSKVKVKLRDEAYQKLLRLGLTSVESEILFNGYSLEYCQEIVDRFEIANLLNKHPHSLSEGQKRKVTIASILASKPSVVLLDEPTVGQDYDGLNKIVNILYDIHEKTNNTMITITHDIRCAKALCNKVVWLENKSIYKTGGHELLDEYFKINN